MCLSYCCICASNVLCWASVADCITAAALLVLTATGVSVEEEYTASGRPKRKRKTKVKGRGPYVSCSPTCHVQSFVVAAAVGFQWLCSCLQTISPAVVSQQLCIGVWSACCRAAAGVLFVNTQYALAATYCDVAAT
jgi:hypothetical protein